MRPEERYLVCSIGSPLGPLQAVASPRGLCRLRIRPGPAVELAGETTGPVEEAPDFQVLKTLADELGEYFAGNRRSFSTPVDLHSTTPFQQAVLLATLEIPYGKTRSYGALAAELGQPTASRAVGGALARNPISILVPCHRVVGGDGHLGGYTGGVQIKQFLLELEGWLRPSG